MHGLSACIAIDAVKWHLFSGPHDHIRTDLPEECWQTTALQKWIVSTYVAHTNRVCGLQDQTRKSVHGRILYSIQSDHCRQHASGADVCQDFWRPETPLVEGKNNTSKKFETFLLSVWKEFIRLEIWRKFDDTVEPSRGWMLCNRTRKGEYAHAHVTHVQATQFGRLLTFAICKYQLQRC